MPFENERLLHAAPWDKTAAPISQMLTTAENSGELQEDEHPPRKRAIPLKKRKRHQPRACSPNESSEATMAQSYSLQFQHQQEGNALQIHMPAHFAYNPASGMERNCPSSETVPSVSTNSAVAGAPGPASSEQGYGGRERKPLRQNPIDDSSHSDDSDDDREVLHGRVHSSLSSTDQQSSCRSDFFKKRGRKLPKALRHAVSQEQEIFPDRKPSPVSNLPLGSVSAQQPVSLATPANLHAANPSFGGEAFCDTNQWGNISSWSAASEVDHPQHKRPSKILKKQWAAAAAAANDVLERSRGNTPTSLEAQQNLLEKPMGVSTNFAKESATAEVHSTEETRPRLPAGNFNALDDNDVMKNQNSSLRSLSEGDRYVSSVPILAHDATSDNAPFGSSVKFRAEGTQRADKKQLVTERRVCDAFAPVGSQTWDKTGSETGESAQSARGWFKPSEKTSHEALHSSNEQPTGSKSLTPRLVSNELDVGVSKNNPKQSEIAMSSNKPPPKPIHNCKTGTDSLQVVGPDVSAADIVENVNADDMKRASKQERIKKKRKKKREKALRELAEQTRDYTEGNKTNATSTNAPDSTKEPMEVEQSSESCEMVGPNEKMPSPPQSNATEGFHPRTPLAVLEEAPHASEHQVEFLTQKDDNHCSDKADEYSDSDSILNPVKVVDSDGSKRSAEGAKVAKKSDQHKAKPEISTDAEPENATTSRATNGGRATTHEVQASDSEADESEEEEQLWIQCDRCKKWRIIPTSMNGWLPRIWRCEENIWDPERASCDVAQQELEEDEYHVGNEAKTIKSIEKSTTKPATANKQNNGNTIRRPRGRPPLGKVWDPVRGMYVPEEEYRRSHSEKGQGEGTQLSSPKPITCQSSDNVKKSKKRKNLLNSPGLSPKRKKKKPNSSSVKKKRSRKKHIDGPRDRKQMEKLLEIGKREAKAELEREKNKIMCRLPSDVKILFGQVGFAKWGREALPALALSPYKVPPGAARDAWMNMFKRLKKSGHLDDICILVHWYGEQEPDNLFSLLDISKFIPYSEASPDVRNYAKNARQKQKLEKKLTKGDIQRLRAMEELKADLAKAPVERQPVHFKERDELLTLEDVEEYLDEEIDESDDDEESLGSNPPVEKKVSVDDGYSTLEDSEDDLEDGGLADTPESARKRPTVKKKGHKKGSQQISQPSTASPKHSDGLLSSPLESKTLEKDQTGASAIVKKPEKPASDSAIPVTGSQTESTSNPPAEMNYNPAALVSELGIDCPSSQDLGGVRVDDLVQTVFMNAKGRAEGSALMGTVMHVVNRLREQRDAALKQCAALQVERANLLALLDSSGSDERDGPRDVEARARALSEERGNVRAEDHGVNFKSKEEKTLERAQPFSGWDRLAQFVGYTLQHDR
eukprot:CAMPEP_0168844242 /NCGR_PEP_ID=MMETSP0727-20121128/8639_1 /TAXON_ID=265536 /ORGANISM="Amphiprora sp., Strain CCMP467" /LENGTH=1384 /DNA_ID=CAMNT_0008897885 /DNA_START=92 /DNA_END=4244 /DNA_ORIENTATION=-